MMPVQPNEVQTLADAVDKATAEAPMRPNEIAKRRVEDTVRRLVSLIQRDKEKILEVLRVESAQLVEECRTGARPRHSFLPMTQEIFAKRMWDLWTEEERKDVQVYEGFCFVGRHQWFVAAGEPEEVEEAYWEYIIDPLPLGLRVYTADVAAPANVIVAPPMSLWQKNYLGAPEEMMRLSEQREQTQYKTT
jgi:hypothetical protein